MKIVSLLFAATCIVAGSTERRPVCEQVSVSESIDARGVSFSCGVMHESFDAQREGGLFIFFR